MGGMQTFLQIAIEDVLTPGVQSDPHSPEVSRQVALGALGGGFAETADLFVGPLLTRFLPEFAGF